MIRIEKQLNGDLKVSHGLEHPSVYLDHWAVMDFASDTTLTARLREDISRVGGTLVISWMNLIEFAKVTDRSQGGNAEAFIDTFLPRVFLMESDPYRVNIHSRSANPNDDDLSVVDNELLKQIIMECYSDNGNVSVSGIIQAIQTSELSTHSDAFAEKAKDAIVSLSLQTKNDPLAKKLGSAGTDPAILVNPLAYIRRELLRKLILAKGQGATQNDAMDLFHVVRAVTHCTHVLVDGQWAAWVNEIKARIASGGVADPYSRVYSKRRDGVDKLFVALETDI
jgi:hypothetical protein